MTEDEAPSAIPIQRAGLGLAVAKAALLKWQGHMRRAALLQSEDEYAAALALVNQLPQPAASLARTLRGLADLYMAQKRLDDAAGMMRRIAENGGREITVPFSRTSSARSSADGAAESSRYGSGRGSRAGGCVQAAASASSGVIHAETEVANDLPRNGPSGTYSHAWMSRADQSLSRHTPNTCSAKSATGTRPPGCDGEPTTNATSASMSSRRDGPKPIVPSAPRDCPHGRITSVPETTTVPARP